LHRNWIAGKAALKRTPVQTLSRNINSTELREAFEVRVLQHRSAILRAGKKRRNRFEVSAIESFSGIQTAFRFRTP
jgi:hypothetical protein